MRFTVSEVPGRVKLPARLISWSISFLPGALVASPLHPALTNYCRIE